MQIQRMDLKGKRDVKNNSSLLTSGFDQKRNTLSCSTLNGNFSDKSSFPAQLLEWSDVTAKQRTTLTTDIKKAVLKNEVGKDMEGQKLSKISSQFLEFLGTVKSSKDLDAILRRAQPGEEGQPVNNPLQDQQMPALNLGLNPEPELQQLNNEQPVNDVVNPQVLLPALVADHEQENDNPVENDVPNSLMDRLPLQGGDAFGADAKAFDEMRTYKDEASHDLKATLGRPAMRGRGFHNIIHFGNNSTIKGLGVAAKGPAKDVYGGTELTFANIQQAIRRLDRSPAMRERTNYVRNVNNARISVVRLETALSNNEVIYFHLNLFNRNIIRAIIDQDENYSVGKFNPVKGSVTAQEFYHIYANWDRFRNNVLFMRNLKPVNKPWE
ncbi:hypothetical protein [Kistimonas asteriae]|uniref:hypothetical protein n=1 Tax=Kistimonas asteriae TaxID=517724 RepID=UPI001BA6E809|nr:hypothetical protein [Kistimonas asteriae]